MSHGRAVASAYPKTLNSAKKSRGESTTGKNGCNSRKGQGKAGLARGNRTGKSCC